MPSPDHRNAVRRRTVSALLAALAVFTGCDRQGPPPQTAPLAVPPSVAGDRALQAVGELLALGPRPSGSAAAAAAAAWIARQAEAAGYAATVDTWQEQTAGGLVTFRNVEARLAGSDTSRFIIIGSHYDTKRITEAPDFVGANDGGSSTGLLLEIMRALHDAGWHGPELRFAFFDGEEALGSHFTDDDGLHGSRKMARDLEQKGEVERCRAMLLLDMIGDRDLKVTISPGDDGALTRTLFAVAAAQGTRSHFGFFLRGNIQDDHIPFQRLGIPALDLIDFRYGPNNSYWHTSEDTLDKLSPDSLAIVGNALIGLLYELAAEGRTK